MSTETTEQREKTAKRSREEEREERERKKKREPYEVECDKCGTVYETIIPKGWVCGTGKETCRCGLNYTNYYCPVCFMLEEEVGSRIFELRIKDPTVDELLQQDGEYEKLRDKMKKEEKEKRLKRWQEEKSKK